MKLGYAALFLAAFCGCFLTAYSCHLGFNAVLASAAVSLLACFLLPYSIKNIHAAVYSGSFAGMSSFYGAFGVVDVTALSAFAGLLFVTVEFCNTRFPEKAFMGFGGKLGAIAFAASLAAAAVQGHFVAAAVPFSVSDCVVIILAALSGAVLPYAIRQHKFFAGRPVLLSSLFGVCAGLVCFLMPPMLLAAKAFYAGTFVAMSSEKIMPEHKMLFVSGVLCGVLLIVILPLFGSLGGTLGMTAFLSVIAASLFQKHIFRPLRSGNGRSL